MRSSDTVLFVSPGPNLTNPASGEGTRLKNLSRKLSERGWRVLALVPENTADNCPDWIAQQYTYEQWSLPFLTDLNPGFIRSIHRVLSREPVDVIHASTGVCAAQLNTMFGSDTTVVYAAQNVEADHAQDFVNPDLPAYKRLLGPKLIPLIEAVTVPCADGLTTVSEKDKDRFAERYSLNKKNIQTVPTGTHSVNQSELKSPSSVRKQLGVSDGPLAVFHGYYDHSPNREAAELIDLRVAPAMRDHNIEFLLVGANPPEVSSSNVHAVGFVKDLLSVLNVADVAVVPILHGGGTKTKLFDYVSLSIPIVATEKAVEGVDIKSQQHGIITSDLDDEFLASLATVIRDEGLRAELENNLGRLADKWNWEHSADQLEEAYNDFY